MIAIVRMWRRRRTIAETAAVADSLGCQERFITACEFLSNPHIKQADTEKLMLADVKAVGQEAKLSKQYRMQSTVPLGMRDIIEAYFAALE